MMGCETVQNAYLSGDTSLTCSEQTSTKIDALVLQLIKEAHAKAIKILEAHKDDMDRLAAYLLEKETITGEEFMAILHGEQPPAQMVDDANAAAAGNGPIAAAVCTDESTDLDRAALPEEKVVSPEPQAADGGVTAELLPKTVSLPVESQPETEAKAAVKPAEVNDPASTGADSDNL